VCVSHYEIVAVCEDIGSRDGSRVSPPVACQPCSAALLDSGIWSNRFCVCVCVRMCVYACVCVSLWQGTPGHRSEISQGLINYLKQMKNLEGIDVRFLRTGTCAKKNNWFGALKDQIKLR